MLLTRYNTTKMEERRKCITFGSPKALKGFSFGKSLRAEALGWNGWKDTSLEVNQSFPRQVKSKPQNMDWFRVDGLSLASFSNRKWGPNQSPIHVSFSRDEAWLLNEANVSTHPSNNQFESTMQGASSNKAVFTISLPSTQILIVNSVACKMMGFTAEDLCGRKLVDLIVETESLGDLDDSQSDFFSTGNVVELVNREGQHFPVFLFMKKVDTMHRCIAVAELVERRLAVLTIDCSGKIEGWDDEVYTLFQYEPSELLGTHITTLIPALLIDDTGQDKNLDNQRVTGRTKGHASFPLCANVRRTGLNVYEVILWVYSNLSGLFILNQDLTIANCNHQFTSLLFGYSKACLINKSILKLIPNFCDDGEYARDRTLSAERSENSDPIPDISNGEVIATPTDIPQTYSTDIACGEPIQDDINNRTDDCIQQLDELVLSSCESSLKSSIIGDLDFELQNKITEKFSSLNKCDFKVWSTESRIRNSRSDDILAKSKSSSSSQVVGATSNLDLKGSGLCEFPMNRALNVSNLSDLEGEEQVRAVREGTYAGLGRHCDGCDLDIVYRVQSVRQGKGWCVCIARDPWELAEGGRARPLNLTITSSFNSASMDASVTKDSDIPSRPNSASIISQADDVLTSGEYSEFYTNLQQIGKGAFGYVKMAYRNYDGLLVVTKFIKKHKVHIRSWVIDPVLNMKVPLEISLLTTLEHPNIVRVLDVFHNDAFFQIVMEKHGAGLDLFEFIDRKPQMDEKLASYIFRQMIAAVHYLHSLGILHRDIKDENVIINEAFHVKLIDFGSAAFMTPDRLFSTFYGTVEFCSPEVLGGNKYRGPELEVWALGVTLYIIVFGENPFYDVEETMKGEFVIPHPLSSSLFALLNGMLEKDVSARWDVERIFADPWVNQPVDPGNFNFQEIVQCYNDEAFPVRYIHELAKDDVGKEEEDDDRTVASSNSFCSLHTIENLDAPDQFHDSFESPCVHKDVPHRLLHPSSHVLSSTPRRASATKSVSPSVRDKDVEKSASQKRYSLDLNTLKKLCETTETALENKTVSSDLSKTPVNGDDGINVLFDVPENKLTSDEFENYWDAEDEQFDEDSL